MQAANNDNPMMTGNTINTMIDVINECQVDEQIASIDASPELKTFLQRSNFDQTDRGDEKTQIVHNVSDYKQYDEIVDFDTLKFQAFFNKTKDSSKRKVEGHSRS